MMSKVFRQRDTGLLTSRNYLPHCLKYVYKEGEKIGVIVFLLLTISLLVTVHVR